METHRCLGTAFLIVGYFAIFGSGVVVDTKYGPVQGRTLTLHSGESLNTFYNIPFAKPPLDALRWQPPQEPDAWNGTYIAEELGNVCPQERVGEIILTHPTWNKYDEDCLNLNIVTPADISSGPYPVMVFYHGGSYKASGNIQYPGHFLAARDVVVVSTNYRLGILGFASSGDGAAPGNFGMLDQVQVLHFVQENIANFGGDPGKVTIFGESAGAGSVGLMLMSPLSAGLFHQAILESGSEVAVWAVNTPKQHPETYLHQVAEQLECPIDDSYLMMDCLRTKGQRELRETEFNCTRGYVCLGFVPVVDGSGGFLPDIPSNLRKRGEFNKVPEMIGTNREEVSIFLLGISMEFLVRGPNRTEYDAILESALSYLSTNVPDPARVPDIYAAVDFYYNPWPNTEDPEKLREALIELGNDAAFVATMDYQMKHHHKYAPVYNYLFAYKPKNATRIPDWIGTPHIFELPYVFGYPMIRLNDDVRNETEIVDIIRYNDEDVEYSQFMITLWTNFAKYGNPTPVPVQPPKGMDRVTWPEFTFDDLDYIFIGDDIIESRANFKQRESAFWMDYMEWMAFGDDSPWDGDTPPRPSSMNIFGGGDINMAAILHNLLRGDESGEWFDYEYYDDVY